MARVQVKEESQVVGGRGSMTTVLKPWESDPFHNYSKGFMPLIKKSPFLIYSILIFFSLSSKRKKLYR